MAAVDPPALDVMARTARAGRFAARPGFLAASAAMGALVALNLLIRSSGRDNSDLDVIASVTVVTALGLLLVARRPENKVSWLLYLAGAAGWLAAATAAAEPSATDITATSPLVVELEWWQMLAGLLGGPAWFGFIFIVIGYMPLWFPTGKAPSPRWNWVSWLLSASLAAYVVSWLLQESFCLQTGWGEANAADLEAGCQVMAYNPIGIAGVRTLEENALASVALLAGPLSAVIAAFVRFRRSVGVERLQLKWFAFSLAFFLGLTIVSEFLDGRVQHPVATGVLAALSAVAWVAVPGSITLAVLRYRLFEIDRIISRTVSYAVVALVVAAVYAVPVVFLPSLVGTESDLVVAGSTLAAAAVFNPVRRRVQSMADRRFNRSRFDAQREVAVFGERLRSEADLPTLVRHVDDLLARTVQAQSVAVWVRAPTSATPRASAS